LLLDDPVSAIDPETENEVMTAVEQATQGRTTLIVASRLSTLRYCDRVIVIESGAIVQEGTHEALMNQPGFYQDVATTQGQRQRTDNPRTKNPRGDNQHGVKSPSVAPEHRQ